MFAQKHRENERTQLLAEEVVKGAERTVVAAVDISDFSKNVFDFVAAHFNTAGTTVVFVHAVPPIDGTQLSRTIEAQEAEKQRPFVEKWVTAAKEKGLACTCEGLLLYGDPKEEVVLFTKVLKPDALLVASHEKNLFGRLLTGSHADHYVNNCPCAVIVVKPPHA